MSPKKILFGFFVVANLAFVFNWFRKGVPLGFDFGSIDYFGENKTCINNDTFVKFVRFRCEDDLCFSLLPKHCRHEPGNSYASGEVPTHSFLNCTIIQTTPKNQEATIKFQSMSNCFGEILPKDLNLSYAGFNTAMFFINLTCLSLAWISYAIVYYCDDVPKSTSTSTTPVTAPPTPPVANNLLNPTATFDYTTQKFTIKEDQSAAAAQMSFDFGEMFGRPYRVRSTLYIPLKTTAGILQLRAMQFKDRNKADYASSLLNSFLN
jgi:hypothetical protein